MSSKVTASVTNARPRLSVVIVDAVIDSSSVVPVVEAASIRPTASADYIAPVATTTIVIPATEIAYINMVFSADIDVSGLFSFKIDSVAMQDGTAFSFTKSPTDLFVVLDGLAYAFDRPLADSITLADLATTTLVFIRDFADTQNIDDATVLNFVKSAASSVLASELLAKSFDKSSAEVVTISELAAKSVAKYLVDSLNTGDATYLNSQKLFDETQTITDSAIRDISKILSDSAIPADAIAFDITKLLSDGFAMNDSADATDGLTFSFSIGIENIIFSSDAEQKSFEKTRTDSLSLLDSGFILQQDYIDLTYFAEDYVGIGYTF